MLEDLRLVALDISEMVENVVEIAEEIPDQVPAFRDALERGYRIIADAHTAIDY